MSLTHTIKKEKLGTVYLEILHLDMKNAELMVLHYISQLTNRLEHYYYQSIQKNNNWRLCMLLGMNLWNQQSEDYNIMINKEIDGPKLILLLLLLFSKF